MIVGGILVGVFLAVQYRRRSLLSPAQRKNLYELPRPWEWLLFCAILLAFWIDQELGFRFLGLVVVGYGIVIIVTRRVPYGIEGHAPSGYITGGFAVVIGVLQIALGIVLLAAPHVVATFLAH